MPHPGGTYRDKKRLDARLEGLLNPAPRPAAHRGGLRAVDEDTSARRGARIPIQPVHLEEGGPLLRVARADDQARISATKILRPLGWSPATDLRGHVDLHAQLGWVQRAELPAPAHEGEGCERDCCRDARRVPDLPGDPTPNGERLSIDSKRQLCLSDGLLAAAGLHAPGELVVVIVPDLHALLVTGPGALIGGRLAHLFTDAPTSALEPTSATDQPDRRRANVHRP
jgi:hypothetical protein